MTQEEEIDQTVRSIIGTIEGYGNGVIMIPGGLILLGAAILWGDEIFKKL